MALFSARPVGHCLLSLASPHAGRAHAGCVVLVLQELWRLYESNKLGDGVLISDKNKLPDFEDLVRSSKFCLAPWGHGWGNRLGMYMILGCVPVIVQVRRMRESLKVCMQ